MFRQLLLPKTHDKSVNPSGALALLFVISGALYQSTAMADLHCASRLSEIGDFRDCDHAALCKATTACVAYDLGVDDFYDAGCPEWVSGINYWDATRTLSELEMTCAQKNVNANWDLCAILANSNRGSYCR